ncbi:hypothetical protein K3495_g5596 [Podosphaera aphanis]|nr:hypothetical protein K3495_g5596 [Podosphaera aphanis]
MANFQGESSALQKTDIYNRHPESDMIHVSQIIGAIRTDKFSWRAPSPPHIHVPQITEDFMVQLPTEHFTSGPDENFNDIMKEITDKFKPILPTEDWKYVWRRQAQQVIPFLYLGPSSAARDIKFITQEKITMLLAVRDTAIAQARLISGDKVAHSLGIEAATVDVAGHMGLIAALPEAINMINNHIVSVYKKSNGSILGKVLVFCESGNERSPAVVAAYLMSTYGLDTIAAIQLIQSQRFCVSLDDGFKWLLCNYMEILAARKEVRSAAHTSSISTEALLEVLKRKREQNPDIEMTQDDDEERFCGRGGYMPFR